MSDVDALNSTQATIYTMDTQAALQGLDNFQRYFDPRAYLESYYHPSDNQRLLFMLKHFAEIFNSGKVKGDTMIDIGTGPSIYHLLSACEVFKDITVSDFSDRSREEFEAWLTNQPGAFDWSPVVKNVCQLEGDRISWTEKQDRLRKAIKRVLKCDVMKSNPTDPVVLPQADCIISCLCLESACKDHEDYVTALNNMTSMLKPGGYLVLAGVLGGKYYWVGKVKFFSLHLTEAFIRESLTGAGYVIEKFESTGEREEPWEKSSNIGGFHMFVAKKNS